MTAPRRFAEFDPVVCLNCGADLDVDDRFCRDCGQRNRRHARSIIAWVAEGLSSLFHLEGKLVNTLRDLPRPGRYAYNYLNGQRARYVHPLRLLLFSSLVCFASMSAIGWLSDDFQAGYRPSDEEVAAYRNGFTEGLSGAEEPPYRSARAVERRRAATREAERLVGARDSVRARRDEAVAAGLDRAVRGDPEDEFAEAVESLEDQLEDLGQEAEDLLAYPVHPAYARMRNVDQLRADLAAHDRVRLLGLDLVAGGLADGPEAMALLDTIVASFPMPESQFSGPAETDDDGFNVFGERYAVDARLLATADPQEIADSMRLEEPVNRLLAPKIVALYHDGIQNIFAYLASNVSWAVLLFVPLIALGYYLFYWGRMPYYAQNLAYAAILLSVTLLAFTVGAGMHAVGLGGLAWPVLGTAVYAYMVLGEAYLYGVPWWKALFKNAAIGLYGTVAFTFAVLLWVFLAVLFV